MVLILAYVFTESYDLSGSRFARDVKTSHSNTRSCSPRVHHAPHAFDHRVMNVFGDGDHFRVWTRRIQWLKFDGCMIAERRHFLQQVWNVHLPTLADGRDRPDKRDWRDDVVHLAERGVNRIDVAPLGISRLHAPLEFARRRPAYDFVRQVDAGAFVEIKLVNHADDAVDPHLQTETIEIAGAGDSNGPLHVRHAVIAHAARELVSNLDTTTARQTGMVKRDRALFKSGHGHRDLPCRTRRITTLNRAVEQRCFRIV